MNPLRSSFEYFLARWAALFIEALPTEVAWLIGRVIGRLTFLLDYRHRRVGAQNLRRVYPGLTPGQIHSRLRAVYDHLGKVMVEMVRGPRLFRRALNRRSAETTSSAAATGMETAPPGGCASI